MILPVSSCYHNHSFLHFRLTSNQTGGKKKSYKQKDTVSSLPEGKKHIFVWRHRETHVTYGNMGQGAQWAAGSRAQAREVKHHSKHELITAEDGDELKIQTG